MQSAHVLVFVIPGSRGGAAMCNRDRTCISYIAAAATLVHSDQRFAAALLAPVLARWTANFVQFIGKYTRPLQQDGWMCP